jgi:hypothetical protein
MPSRLYGVLLADVVASGASRRLRVMLSDRLARATRIHQRRKWIRLPYAVTAGDEFQTLVADLQRIPSLILDLRRRMRPLSLRIGVGIGKVNGRIVAPVNRLDGEAFRFARQALENLGRPRPHGLPSLSAFRTPIQSFDDQINLLYALADTLVMKITEKQWQTIGARMDSRTLERAARALRLDASTVSRNLKRGYYSQLLAVAAEAERRISAYF